MAIVINGSGTVTGISVGGLPDGIVDAGTLATNSVDSAELIDGSVDTAHLAAIFPQSSSDLINAADAQDIDIALSAGTYAMFCVCEQSDYLRFVEVGYIVSDGSTLTISEVSFTGTVIWSNPSGTTLRIRDNNDDKTLGVFGWRIK